MTSLVLTDTAGPHLLPGRHMLQYLGRLPYLPPGRQMLQDQLVCSQTFKSIQHSVDKWQLRFRVGFQTKKSWNKEKNGRFVWNLSSYWLAYFYLMKNLPKYCASRPPNPFSRPKPLSKHKMYGSHNFEDRFSEKMTACAHTSRIPMN